jgi:hypothetical protein
MIFFKSKNEQVLRGVSFIEKSIENLPNIYKELVFIIFYKNFYKI